VTAQEWIWIPFVFAFGCVIGSFLNVVIYRMPREKSLVSPGSACPGCDKPIAWYDNIPLLSWAVLGGKCRHCHTRISPRYFIVELITAVLFLGLYLVYFQTGIRSSMLVPGGWFVYLIHLVLIAAFIGASGIDLEFWIIPLSICWLVTGVGLVGSTVGPYFVDPEVVRFTAILPAASPGSGAIALGAAVGLGISLLLLRTGLITRSYDVPEGTPEPDKSQEVRAPTADAPDPADPDFNHRLESLREILFLIPVVGLAVAAHAILRRPGAAADFWDGLLAHPAVAGLLGSLFGYFVGCAVVWGTRILGTLAFGREAMGLGDVHLMGAAGAVIGPAMVVVAFFIAPFFGLAWAFFQAFSKKIRQIPYGPFLSLAVLAVMICHDWILNRFALLFLG
jgi:leader peptidase (prepilin peptidase)/N-methyltransferase